MTERPIFVHIGCSKSGTSSLQRALYASVDRLEAQGIGLPIRSRGQALRMLRGPMERVQSSEPPRPTVQRQLSELVDLLHDTPGDRLLITLEDLAEQSEASASTLVEALAGFEVHVIITARDWSRQIPSDWQELVKQRLQMPYLDFVQAVRDNSPEADRFRIRQHVPDIARRWGARVPTERMHIIAVPPPVPDPNLLFNLVGDIVGFDADALVVPPGLVNRSLGYEQTETLRRVNVALGDRLTDVRREYRPSAQAVLFDGLRRQQGSRLTLPAEHLEWCRAVCVEMLDELTAGGYHLVGDPQRLVPSLEDALPAARAVSDAEVAHAAVDALAELVDLHHRQRVGRARRDQAAAKLEHQRVRQGQ